MGDVLAGLNPVQRYHSRLVQMRSHRASHDEHWKDLATYQLPRSARFTPASDKARAGTKRNEKIYRDDGGDALEVGSKGLMSGATPATRPWFGLATPDPEMMEYQPIKVWLDQVEDRLRWAFQKSNVYNALYQLHEGNFAFGTSAFTLEEDLRTIMRAEHLPIGSYFLACGPTGVVDTCYRELAPSVEQVVKRWGKEKCSQAVKSLWDSGNYDTTVHVIQVVQPRQYDASKQNAKNMPFKSCYFEYGHDELLGESGYREFPVIVARWSVIGQDAYGSSCPGMRALPGIKALQFMEQRKLNIAAKLADPSMVGPADLRKHPGAVNLLPGGTTFIDLQQGQKFEPAHLVDPRSVQILDEIQNGISQRIFRAYFADLFQAVMRMDQEGEPVTAAEIYARIEEKAHQLGPVLHRLESDTLRPLVDRAYSLCERAGLLPPPPPELAGMELKVEFKSVLHQAQGASDATGIANVAQFAAQLAELKPDIMDKIDWDQAIDVLARVYGVPASVILPDDEVAKIRAARAQEQQQAAMAEQAKGLNQAAQAANTLSQTPINGQPALDGLMQAVA